MITDQDKKDLFNEYIKAYNNYNRKEGNDDHEYILMQSIAIRIVTDLKLSYHQTYKDIYEYCQDEKKKLNNI